MRKTNPRRKPIKHKKSKVAPLVALTIYPAYYQQSDEDGETCGRLGQIEYEARMAAGTWPDAKDQSELGKMKLGRALRQLNEHAARILYRPVVEWLRDNGYSIREIISIEDGAFVTIEFLSAAGQQAFLNAFPQWQSERPKMWFDDIPTGQSMYDLPDAFNEIDGQHRRKTIGVNK